MKIRRLICAALAASLALCPAAFAADTPKTDRIVTTQNGHRLLGVLCGAAYHPGVGQQPEL